MAAQGAKPAALRYAFAAEKGGMGTYDQTEGLDDARTRALSSRDRLLLDDNRAWHLAERDEARRHLTAACANRDLIDGAWSLAERRVAATGVPEEFRHAISLMSSVDSLASERYDAALTILSAFTRRRGSVDDVTLIRDLIPLSPISNIDAIAERLLHNEARLRVGKARIIAILETTQAHEDIS